MALLAPSSSRLAGVRTAPATWRVPLSPAAVRKAARNPSVRASPSDQSALPVPAYPGSGFLTTACSVLTVGAIAKGIAGVFAPSALLTAAFGAAAVTPVNTALTGAAVAVAWLYAAWLQALRDAVIHARLGSDTYRRLSFGLLGLATFIFELTMRCGAARAGGALPPPVMYGLTFVACVFIGFLGTKLYSAADGRTPFDDAKALAKGFVSGVGSLLTVPKNIFSAVYAYQAVCSLGMFVLLFPTALTPLFPGGLDAVGSYLVRAIAAGAWLIGLTAFTLKDASDRGRLGASTFKLLNIATAATVAQLVFFMWTLGGAGVPLHESLWRLILANGVVSIVACDVAYLTAKK